MSGRRPFQSNSLFNKTPSGIGVLVALICVSIVLVTLYGREGSTGPVHMLRSAAQVVATPFDWLGSQCMRPFDALGNMVRNMSADGSTLSELEEENARLQGQLASLGEYQAENARLEAMLGLTSAYGMAGTAARVVGGSSSDWDATVVINKGSSDGLAVGMPVVDGNGAVGQITAVSPSSATVTLLSDPTSGVSALLQGSRSTGVLEGSVDGVLRLEYVPATVPVTVGELVVTSGLGGVYPAGVLLGSVASVSSGPSDLYHTIVVNPVASTSNYSEVFVMTGLDSARADEAARSMLETGSYSGATQGEEGT